MQKHASKKVAGGKLVRVDVSYVKGNVSDVKIFGDFFLTPEDTIVLLESKLANMPLPLPEDMAVQLQEVLLEHQAQLIGISCDDIVECVHEAVGLTKEEINKVYKERETLLKEKENQTIPEVNPEEAESISVSDSDEDDD
jgi:hypothetical protein